MQEPEDPPSSAYVPDAAAVAPSANGGPDGSREGGPDGSPDDDRQAELDRLRREVRDLRGKLVAHPLISQAQGMLQERYRLPDAESAFELMKRCSQQHNMKLRSLASAVVSVPRPDEERGLWFPGRSGRTPPALRFLPGHRPDKVNRSTVLKQVLHQALSLTDASMGDLQTMEPAVGLRMEHHYGLSEEFLDFFALVEEGTPCFLAARRQVRVVSDIATDPVVGEPAREMILSVGSRTAHSIPMLSATGRTVGVFSLHLPRENQELTRAQATALEGVAAQAGRWLEWHQRTILLNALEDLHRRGTALRARPPRRPTD
ncbi:ANTAR domain-containing protein [Streptomyces albofaciens JCM 4342]|uniref:GAF and ANTAR domain-containing protein n=1 Tax=Streptomyces albofaciens TaxID=66866 RepID=UPI00123A3254|nr:GAF and ANTAR domain-containing protein [Streptomyces albofaciens]KAA6223720.1 ANTAR domain-containing protein [Streptomyces albofaciens JCM 4342]